MSWVSDARRRLDADRRKDARLPPYVSRDVHGTAVERLRSRGILLVIGQPVSGMTRTAFEGVVGQ